MIKTICYGYVDEWGKRQDAIRHFMTCAECSEGAERERYTTILLQLLEGEDIATDGSKEHQVKVLTKAKKCDTIETQ